MTEWACTIDIEHTESGPLVSIGGEFDLAAVAAVRGALDPLLAGWLRVDLGGVSFMDSSALQCLLQLRAAATERNGRLVVAGHVPRTVERLLQLTGVHDGLLDAE